MEAFDLHQEERKIAQEIKKKFDKDFSKWTASDNRLCV
jgi:hypothetical protein